MQNSPSGDCVKIYSNGCIDFDTASTEYNNVQRDFSIYHNKLFQKLRNNTRCLSGGPYATTVTINRESTESLLLKYQISRSSGNNIADKNTMDALRKTLPFELLPSSCSILYPVIEVTFIYNCPYKNARKCNPHF